MKLLLLASGEGKRFTEQGYNIPKVMLPVPTNDGIKPMFQAIIDNVFEIFNNNITEIIVVKRKEHDFEVEFDNVTYINVEKTTGGAACSALLAKEHLLYNNKHENILVVNCDQLIEVDEVNFKTVFSSVKSWEHSMIFTFQIFEKDEKWSFAKIDIIDGEVLEVAEKRQISDLATCGLYYFDSSKVFVDSIELMMLEENNKFNGEFYVVPCYNELIKTYNVNVFNVSNMIPLGVPDDYTKYLNSFQLDYDKVNNKLIPMEINL